MKQFYSNDTSRFEALIALTGTVTAELKRVSALANPNSSAKDVRECMASQHRLAEIIIEAGNG